MDTLVHTCFVYISCTVCIYIDIDIDIDIDIYIYKKCVCVYVCVCGFVPPAQWYRQCFAKRTMYWLKSEPALSKGAILRIESYTSQLHFCRRVVSRVGNLKAR